MDNSISINDLIDSTPKQKPAASLDQQVHDIVVSNVGAVLKLAQIYSLSPSFLGSIAQAIDAAVLENDNATLIATIKADKYMAKVTDGDMATIHQMLSAVSAVSNLLKSHDRLFKDAIALGSIQPTFCDLFEAFAKIYEENFTSMRPFISRLTERNDALIGIVFDCYMMGAKIILNLRSTARQDEYIKQAQDIIGGDSASTGTTTGSDNTGDATGSTSNGTTTNSDSKSDTDKLDEQLKPDDNQATSAADKAKADALAQEALKDDDALLNPKD